MISETKIRRALRDGVPDCSTQLVDQIEVLYQQNMQIMALLAQVRGLARERRNTVSWDTLLGEISAVLEDGRRLIYRGRRVV